MVHFPSLLCKLGLQKFLIEDSSISDKGTRHSVSQTLLKKFFCNLFLTGGELLHNSVLASAVQHHESAMGVYVPSLRNPRPPPTPGHLLWVITEHEAAPPASYSTFPRPSILHAVVCVFPCYSLRLFHPLLPTRLFCMSAALRICPQVPSFWIPFIRVNTLYLSCSTCTPRKDSISSSIWLRLVLVLAYRVFMEPSGLSSRSLWNLLILP